MIRMFVRHDVTDYGMWRKACDDFDAERRKMGVVGAALYRSAENEDDVTVTHDLETLDRAKAFAGSSRLRDVMKGRAWPARRPSGTRPKPDPPSRRGARLVGSGLPP